MAAAQPEENSRDSTLWLRRVVFVLALLLTVLALVAWNGPGLRLAVGPVRISATNPSHLLLEGAALWLIGSLVAPRRHRLGLLCPLGAVVLAGIIDASPRRVGDAAEYVGMTLRMNNGLSPTLVGDESQRLLADVIALPGFADARFDLTPPGRDAGQRFYHFWLYSFLATPFASITRVVGAHPVYAFTALNLLLFTALTWWLAARGRAIVAVLIVAGPLIWWVDKAHTEVFLFVLLTFAALLVERYPFLALTAAAIAAAQNPAALVVVGVCGVAALVRRHDTRNGLAGVLVAAVIVAIPPVYYWWTMGTWSPLTSTIGRYVPGVRALLTPLLDPNLGLIFYAPILVILAVLGISRVSRRTAWVCGSTIALLLVVVTQSANVNHGGTPSMSRYGIWLLAFLVPFIGEGVDRLQQKRPGLLVAAMTVSIAFSLWIFRPALEEHNAAPNALAAQVWNSWPSLDNPLPEVFADRVSGADGLAPVPVATRGCTKVLTRGDGDTAWWPFPCAPLPAPDECRREGALCYVNAGVYRVAPEQPLFTGLFRPAHSWTATTATRLQGILARLGGNTSFVRLGGGSQRAEGGSQLTPLYIVEGRLGAAIWIQPAQPALTTDAVKPTLRLRLTSPSVVDVLDGTTLVPARTSLSLPPGVHALPVDPGTLSLVLVADTP